MPGALTAFVPFFWVVVALSVLTVLRCWLAYPEKLTSSARCGDDLDTLVLVCLCSVVLFCCTGVERSEMLAGMLREADIKYQVQ